MYVSSHVQPLAIKCVLMKGPEEAYNTTVLTTSPALIPPYEEVTLGRQVTAERQIQRQTTVSATKRAIIPPYYEKLPQSDSRQVL